MGKDKRQHSAAARIVSYGNMAAVRLYDFEDDREPEARPAGLGVLPAPEALEDMLTVLKPHTLALVSDADASRTLNAHCDLCVFRRMRKRVLNEIPERILDGVPVAFDCNRSVGPN